MHLCVQCVYNESSIVEGWLIGRTVCIRLDTCSVHVTLCSSVRNFKKYKGVLNVFHVEQFCISSDISIFSIIPSKFKQPCSLSDPGGKISLH